MYTKTPRPLDSLHIGSKQHTLAVVLCIHLAPKQQLHPPSPLHDGYSVVKPTASTSTKGIEDTDDDVLWIQWPSSDELEAVGHRDAGDRSIDRSIEEVDSCCWLSG
jgi:hypothetical protein